MNTYVVNETVVVQPGRNEINDVKVEPRLMKLLCILLESKGQLVSRSYITETIWEGYGGGNDGLTQAISFLRKIFNDTNKRIIETIPKSGYIFNGSVRVENTAPGLPIPPAGKKKIVSKLAITATVLVFLLVLFGYIADQSKDAKQPGAKNTNLNLNYNHDSLHKLKHEAWLKKQAQQVNNKSTVLR